MDAAGRIVEWNRQAESTFGWSRDEAVGRFLAETIIPPRHRAEHEHGLASFLATGAGTLLNRRLEVAALHRDGHEFAAELTITPVRLGRHLSLQRLHSRHHARKKAREDLDRERNLLRTLMDNLPDHIFVKDRASRFVTANAATLHSLGVERLEDAVGKTDFDFLPLKGPPSTPPTSKRSSAPVSR